MKRFISFLSLMMLVLLTYGCTDESSVADMSFETGNGAVDLGIANKEKLIEMLKREGKLSLDASPLEAEEALKLYLNTKMSEVEREKNKFDTLRDRMKPTLDKDNFTNSIFNGVGNKLGQTELLSSVVEESWDGSVTKDNILVILIDYPDFKNSTMTPNETDMFYEQYTKEHYEDMLFGENGYTGPNGENLLSMRQYYEEQSGGSYTVEGKVAGWYTASQPAVYYGGGGDNPRPLVYEALVNVTNDPSINLSEFDKEDRYDLDADGDLREPDGIIDHLMIIHAGVGEEAGGGTLGEDAIWSHRWNLGGVIPLPNTETDVPYWDGYLAAVDYTIEPEDGAAGVFAHEYGHDLGLPDEYDTYYTGAGEAVSYWSLMASGSWAGITPGTEPTGFSPYAKLLLQSSLGGNWVNYDYIHVDDVDENGVELLLDEASTKGTNSDMLVIDLPDKASDGVTPYTGEYQYYSGQGNEYYSYMYTPLDLTNATNATLTFDTWYSIEKDWDYASVMVHDGTQWVTIEGNITTTYNPEGQNPGNGITGTSNGWVSAEFDLSQFAGKQIHLGFDYWTDKYTKDVGIYIDNINVNVDSQQVLFDGAENEPLFDLIGYTKDTGIVYTDQFYLVEWRNHTGVDEGLAHIEIGNSLMEYQPGMLVWYVDMAYEDNWVGLHPGEGFLGLVDADQHINKWNNTMIGRTDYQLNDAAFSLELYDPMYLDYKHIGYYMMDNFIKMNPLFDDSFDYMNDDLPDAGRNIPTFGLKIRVVGESEDRSVSKIMLYK